MISSNPSKLVEALVGGESSSEFKVKRPTLSRNVLLERALLLLVFKAGETCTHSRPVGSRSARSEPRSALDGFLPKLTLVRSTRPSCAPVDESDLTDSRVDGGVGASDDQYERLRRFVWERSSLAVAPEGMRSGPLPSHPLEIWTRQQPPIWSELSHNDPRSNPMRLHPRTKPVRNPHRFRKDLRAKGMLCKKALRVL